MEEKILIEGKCSKSKILPIIFFVLAGILLIVCFIVATAYGDDPSWAFIGIEYGYYWFFIGIIIFVALGLRFLLMQFEFLFVTNNKVEGKTIFGKRVLLPISQVSAIGTGLFKKVMVATSAGHIRFYGVINKDEVYSVISELILKQSKVTESGASDL